MKIFIFLTILSLHAQANDLNEVYQNNQAQKLFEEEHIEESKNILQKEVVNHPQNGVLHYNLGLTQEQSKDSEKALQEYGSALKNNSSQNKEFEFRTLFNMARLYGEKNDLKMALQYYQNALEIKPDSEEVKTNIELLIKNGGGGNSDKKQQQQKPQEPKKDNDKKQGQQPQDQKPNQEKRPQPQQFQSKELSEQDVKRVFDELKRQEEQIRAKINNDKPNNKEMRESPPEKDW